jgi:hypothetical protein
MIYCVFHAMQLLPLNNTKSGILLYVSENKYPFSLSTISIGVLTAGTIFNTSLIHFKI